MGLTPGMTWQIHLQGTVDTSVNAQVFDIDAQEATPELVQAILAKPAIPVGYISAGSWEEWRPDAHLYPEEIKGAQFGDWPGEKYVDIRNLNQIMPILYMRILMAKEKGFLAIDWDNLDTYTHTNTGFPPFTYFEQLLFNWYLAKFTHDNGMMVLLKNDVDQVVDLQPYFDGAIVEQAYQYNEAHMYLPFTQNNKAVFMIEYQNITPFCADAASKGFSLIRKNLDLQAYRVSCS